MDQPTYYAIIPANVRYSDLKPNAKLLYGEITCLTQSTGECWASNDYFAKLYKVSKDTASRWVTQLKKKGFVSVSYIFNKDKTIKKRVIKLVDSPITTKKSVPPLQNDHYPPDEIVGDNNTRVNNTRENKSADADGNGIRLAIKQYTDLFKEKYNIKPTNYPLITRKLKELMAADITVEQINGALVGYFSDKDKFVVSQACSINYFASNVQKWVKTDKKPADHINRGLMYE
jgi:hypothetical protein